MEDAQRALEEEKTKSNVWMIIAIISMVIGIILLGVVAYMVYTHHSPQCPECVISPQDITDASHAAAIVGEYNKRMAQLKGVDVVG